MTLLPKALNRTTSAPYAWFCIVTFVLVLGARLWYTENFAVSLPYWDQWDAEGDHLLRRWISDDLEIRQLWGFHNEHRILPTRLTTLALYEATSEWNNLYEARFNAVLCALIAALITWLGTRPGTSLRTRWTTAAVTTACFVLPFSWENFLVGFQSQFYYLLMFTVVATALAAWKPSNPFAMASVVGLCALACLTMGSGLLTAMAAAGAYILGWYTRRGPVRFPEATTVVLLIALVAISLATARSEPGHSRLQAEDLKELMSAMSYILGLPIAKRQWGLFLIWLPGMIALLYRIGRKQLDAADLIMAALLGWSTAQAFAIAYGRGHGLVVVTSRYWELMTPGLIASAWFTARALDLPALTSGQRRCAWTGFLVFLVAFFGAHMSRFNDDLAAVKKSREIRKEQVAHVADYLRTGDPTNLQHPGQRIPYPSAQRLQSLLDNPVLRQTMPAPADLPAAKLPEPLPGQK